MKHQTTKQKHIQHHNQNSLHKAPHYWLRGGIIGFLYYQIYLLISGVYFPELYSSLYKTLSPTGYDIIIKIVQVYRVPILPITYFFHYLSDSNALAFQILIFISVMIYCIILGAIIGFIYKKIRKR